MLKTYKDVERAREIRMWITTVIAPAIVIGYTIVTHDGVQRIAKEKCEKVKNKFRKDE